MNGRDLFNAGGVLKRQGRRIVFPDFGLAVAPADGDGWVGLVIEGGAEVRAIDLRDGTGAADVQGDLPVAGLDLIAENMTFLADVAIRARFQLVHCGFIINRTFVLCQAFGGIFKVVKKEIGETTVSPVGQSDKQLEEQ